MYQCNTSPKQRAEVTLAVGPVENVRLHLAICLAYLYWRGAHVGVCSECLSTRFPVYSPVVH
jgi:hypothetical protein